jgi:hypothetical protein
MMAANRRPPRPATPSRLEDAIARAAAPPTVGSLFSGVGGFDLGFIRAGFDVRWQCEIDRDARDVLCKRFPETDMIYTDVRTMPLHAVERVDVLIGGFPCQDLSVAGRRAGLDGERSGLRPHHRGVTSSPRCHGERPRTPQQQRRTRYGCHSRHALRHRGA